MKTTLARALVVALVLCFLVQAQTEDPLVGLPTLTLNPTLSLDSKLGYVNNMSFSPDGSKYAILEDNFRGDENLRIWDATSGTSFKSILVGVNSLGSGIAYSVDGSALFTVLDNQPIRIWDAKTWTLIGQLPNPTTRYVSSFAVHPSRAELIVAGTDTTFVINAVSGKVLHRASERS